MYQKLHKDSNYLFIFRTFEGENLQFATEDKLIEVIKIKSNGFDL